MKRQHNTRSSAVLRTTALHERIKSTICLKYWGRWVAEWGGKRNSFCFYLLLLLCDSNFSWKVLLFLQGPWYDYTDSLDIKAVLDTKLEEWQYNSGACIRHFAGSGWKTLLRRSLEFMLSTITIIIIIICYHYRVKHKRKQQVVIYFSDYC